MATRRVFSTEDGSTGTTAITTSRSRAYSDIDLTFSKRPGGDIYKKTDAAAVKQAVKNLLMTSQYEKPFEPMYGGGLGGLLFELAVDPVISADLEDKLKDQLEVYEPRARVTNVQTQLDPDNNSVDVQIYFTVVSTNEEVVLETSISRLR